MREVAAELRLGGGAPVTVRAVVVHARCCPAARQVRMSRRPQTLNPTPYTLATRRAGQTKLSQCICCCAWHRRDLWGALKARVPSQIARPVPLDLRMERGWSDAHHT